MSRSTNGESSSRPTSDRRRTAADPNLTAAAAARNQVARRSSKPLLDPHGIYGTRTSYRLRAAQRRQTMQTLFVLAFLLALAVGLFSWARRVVPIAPDWTQPLPAAPSAPSVLPGGAESALLVPTRSGSLLSVSAGSGVSKTLFTAAAPLRAEPLVTGQTVFVPCEDGTLFAVDRRDGKTQWQHHTRSAMTTRPALVRVALPVRAGLPIPAPSAPSAPGAPASALPNAAPAAPVTPQKPSTEMRPVVIAGNDSGEIVALEAGSGKLLWRQAARAPVGDGLAVGSEAAGSARVFVPLLGGAGARGGLLCLDARSGRILWGRGRDLIAAHLAAPVVGAVEKNGRERVFCGGDDGSILCLDARSGRILWKVFAQPLPKVEAANASRGASNSETPSDAAGDVPLGGSEAGAEAILLRGEPLLKTYRWGTQLVLGGNDGGVRCLDARDGRLLWTFDAGAAVRCRPRSLRLGAEGQAVTGSLSAPRAASSRADRGAATGDATGDAGGGTVRDADARDLLLVGSDGPAAFALDARSGAMVWRFDTQGAASDTPHLHNDRLLLVTREGYAQSFPLPR